MIVDQMVRAARVDSSLYAEVGPKESTNREDWTVVLVVAAVGAIVGALGMLIQGATAEVIPIFVGLALQAVLGWLAWSVVSFYVGMRLLGGNADLSQVRRAMAYALVPTVIAPLAFFPSPGYQIAWILTPWLLASGFVAVRALFGFRTDQAIITTVYSFLAYIFVGFLLGAFHLGAAFGL